VIHELDNVAPDISPGVFVAPSADVIGDVRLLPESSVWFGAVLRGDIETITVGRGSNVQDGTAAGFEAIAIENFISPDTVAGAMHTAPGSTQPDWSNGVSTIFKSNAGQLTEYAMQDSVDAVSGLFIGNAFHNDYVVDRAIRARTDWILTQPTRRHYVDAAENPPYRAAWNGEKACEDARMTYWSRETLEISGGGIGFPGVPQPRPEELQLCHATSVMTFGTDSAVRTTESILITRNELLAGFVVGWAEIDLTFDESHQLETASEQTFRGLPVSGFAVITYRNDDANAAVPGVLAAYSSVTRHKRSTSVD